MLVSIFQNESSGITKRLFLKPLFLFLVINLPLSALFHNFVFVMFCHTLFKMQYICNTLAIHFLIKTPKGHE